MSIDPGVVSWYGGVVEVTENVFVKNVGFLSIIRN